MKPTSDMAAPHGPEMRMKNEAAKTKCGRCKTQAATVRFMGEELCEPCVQSRKDYYAQTIEDCDAD